MIKVLIVVVAVTFLGPLAFMVLLGGPQAATDVANIAAACQTMLGAPAQPDSTVAELGGPDAELVAAADLPSQEITATAPGPASRLRGAAAYDFVTSLNLIDNWRALPVNELKRWALNPSGPQPAGAQMLPKLPSAQTNVPPVGIQPDSTYARACAAVAARAARMSPPTRKPETSTRPRPAETWAAVGAVMSAAELLRTVDLGAAQADPRQFYLNYWPVNRIRAGDLVLYDFTTSGPAHFGIATDERRMLATGRCCAPAPVQQLPIPVNSSALSPVAPDDTERQET
jgi:hypothetical protein